MDKKEEYQFKQGDKVLVKDYESDEWKERVYATKYNGQHYVETKYGNELLSHKYIKPYEEQIKWYKVAYKSGNLVYKKLTKSHYIRLVECYNITPKEVTNLEFIKYLDGYDEVNIKNYKKEL